MKLRKLSAAFIASAVLVMPLGSYMTASAEDAPIVFSTFNISGVTDGSSGYGSSVDDIKSIAKGADVHEVMSIYCDDIPDSRGRIVEWLKKMK